MISSQKHQKRVADTLLLPKMQRRNHARFKKWKDIKTPSMPLGNCGAKDAELGGSGGSPSPVDKRV